MIKSNPKNGRVLAMYTIHLSIAVLLLFGVIKCSPQKSQHAQTISSTALHQQWIKLVENHSNLSVDTITYLSGRLWESEVQAFSDSLKSSVDTIMWGRDTLLQVEDYLFSVNEGSAYFRSQTLSYAYETFPASEQSIREFWEGVEAISLKELMPAIIKKFPITQLLPSDIREKEPRINLWLADPVIDFVVFQDSIHPIIDSIHFNLLLDEALQDWAVALPAVQFKRHLAIEATISAHPFPHNKMKDTLQDLGIDLVITGKNEAQYRQPPACDRTPGTLAVAEIGPGYRDQLRTLFVYPAFGEPHSFALEGILRHELGHVLGFLHTCHIRGSQAPCRGQRLNLSFSENAYHEAYDSQSVMKSIAEACAEKDSSLTISFNDRLRARERYAFYREKP